MSFGIELRRERERRGVGLAEIAAATKVSERQLRALEADEHEKLPGGIFKKGMVRSYCRHLGLDEAEWSQRFGAAFESEAQEPDWATFAENVKLNRPRRASAGMRWWGVALMAAAVAVLAWSTWHYLLRRRLGAVRPGAPVVRAAFPAAAFAKKTPIPVSFGA